MVGGGGGVFRCFFYLLFVGGLGCFLGGGDCGITIYYIFIIIIK